MFGKPQSLLLCICIVLQLLVCALYLPVNIMDVDAAQYANISREMTESNSFLQVYEQGKDYLDKPPMLFWLSALSFKLVGVSNWSYKLPSFLIYIVSLFFLYQFVKRFYTTDTALVSVLISASSLAVVLMINDVRTDLLLMSFTCIAFCSLLIYYTYNEHFYFFSGFIAMAFALMTKGPIALIVCGAAVVPHLFMKNLLQKAITWKTLWGMVLIILLLLPMCYGLYTQFDLHPEKIVYGIKSPSGLRFFFWTQSFGRITGESAWANNPGFHYLFINLLWSFFPWTSVFCVGLIYSIYKICIRRNATEYASIFGFILTYTAIGISHYQLPHYIFICIPFISIITAVFIKQATSTWIWFLMGISAFVTCIACIFIIQFVHNKHAYLWFAILACTILLCIILYRFYYKSNSTTLIIPIVLSPLFLVFFGVLNYNFYTPLLKYQASSEIGIYLHQHGIKGSQTSKYIVGDGLNSMHFYCRDIVMNSDTAIPSTPYIITNDYGLHQISHNEVTFDIIKTFDTYNITRLKPEFLLEKTRASQLKKLYLIKRK